MSDHRHRGRGHYPDRPLTACPSGKRCYSTKRLAKEAAKLARASARLRVYACRSCHGFHLTSNR